MSPTPEKGTTLYVLIADIWGPARVPSIWGNVYFITMSDEDGFRGIRFMRDRKGFLAYLQEHVAYSEQ